MRKRMEELACGQFDHSGPNLSFSTDRIELEVLEGADATGEFLITSTNHVNIYGIVYSSIPRMECLTTQFDGEEGKVRYQFHSEGLVEGDICKGEFTIVCSTGEYSLPFVVFISRAYAEASIGKIKTLSDFAKLAREDFDEAYQVFYSKNFPNVIRKEEVKEQLFYEALRKEIPSKQKVECYLVAAGIKKPIHMTLEQESAEYYEVTSSKKEQITIRKNMWGYAEGTVRSDADFIGIEKKKLTTEDFLGSTCFLDYYIREEELHAGKNFGKICLDFPEESLVFSICCSRSKKYEPDSPSVHHEFLAGRIRLMQLYVDYRLRKIVTGIWAKQSIQILDHLLAFRPQEDFYSLMKAQALLINRQRQEARWILEDYKRNCTDRTTAVWGYYLYLCTLMEREESYVNRLSAEIEELFHKNPESPILFWILLFTKEEYYQNGAKRLKAIERWVNKGNDSPYFYLEAYYLLWQDAYLLTRLNPFEIKVLNWARKQRVISRDLALQIISITVGLKRFQKQVFEILCACYEAAPTEEVLSGICSYLIKGQKFGEKYHEWYALGIEQGLRITNLYEAFLASMDQNCIYTIPKMIQMYFRYHNSLPYQHLAVLFVNIIALKEKQEDVYRKYQRMIEQFAMEQIEAGHIDENLAVIYRETLKSGILNHELSEKFSGILFTHKLVCKNSRINRAVIVQKQWKRWQALPVYHDKIRRGTVYFQAYTEDYIVLLADSEGNCFADNALFYDEPLLSSKDYLEYAMRLAPAVPYLVSYFFKKDRHELFAETDEIYFSALLKSEDVSSEFKAGLLPEIIRYYEQRGETGALEEYLEDIDFQKLKKRDRSYLVEQLVEMRLFDTAYRIIHLYGYDSVGCASCVSLCSHEIAACGFEEDDFLLGLSDVTFRKGKYNDVLLIYLCKFYNGPIKYMAEIWKAAGEFEIDTFDFEERILTQMLYSTDYVEYAEQIYESYCMGGGREHICKAYLSYFAHHFVVHDMIVSNHIFFQVEERFFGGQDLNDACGIALLKFYAEKEQLNEKQKELAGRLLSKYIIRNLYLSFFKDIDASLSAEHHLNDKFFVEYHTEPKAFVKISYCFDGSHYVEEEMEETYPGIYVKTFILFFGDEVQYYVTEEKCGEERDVTVSGRLHNHDVHEEHDRSRFALLNDMIFFETLQEKRPLKSCMEEYYQMLSATEELFGLL